MKLRIPVSKWLHGTDDVDKLFDGTRLGSMLHRSQDDKMCCIGIYLEACGVPVTSLTDVGDPADTTLTTIPEQCKWLVTKIEDPEGVYSSEIVNSRDAEELIGENDHQAREQVIAAVFAKHNVEVEFIHDEC